MSTFVYEFTLLRTDESGDEVELNLKAEFEIEPFVHGRINASPEECYPEEGGYADLIPPILITDDDGKKVIWDGGFTQDELDSIQEEAYESWTSSPEDDREPIMEDCILDTEYDYFHDERAIHTANGGKVYY